jgi:hypothetical protein
MRISAVQLPLPGNSIMTSLLYSLSLGTFLMSQPLLIEHHPMLAINNAGIEEGKNTSSAPHTTNGNAHNDINDTNDINYVPDLLHPDDDSSVSKDEFDYDNYDDVILDMEQPITNEEPEISPHGT